MNISFFYSPCNLCAQGITFFLPRFRFSDCAICSPVFFLSIDFDFQGKTADIRAVGKSFTKFMAIIVVEIISK